MTARRKTQAPLLNAGFMAARREVLAELLPRLVPDNPQGEYYLTGIVALAAQAGLPRALIMCGEDEARGANRPHDLARLEAAAQTRLRRKLAEDGAQLIAPETLFASWDTCMAPGAVIEPYVVLGPGVEIGEGARIKSFSHIEGARIGARAQIGPFARLRPQSRIGPGARVGNFVEVKQAELEEGAKASHLAYLGDARIGARANIGAGVITCNYDGEKKSRTEIGPDAFIGSNCALVAPVKIGAGAYIGSGSTISEDIPPPRSGDCPNPRRGQAGPGQKALACAGSPPASRTRPPSLSCLASCAASKYRGYDSAGIAALHKDRLARRRVKGNLDQLARLLARRPLRGTIGIAHTRWADSWRPLRRQRPSSFRRGRGGRP